MLENSSQQQYLNSALLRNMAPLYDAPQRVKTSVSKMLCEYGGHVCCELHANRGTATCFLCWMQGCL